MRLLTAFLFSSTLLNTGEFLFDRVPLLRLILVTMVQSGLEICSPRQSRNGGIFWSLPAQDGELVSCGA